jgi:hypothetical protein
MVARFETINNPQEPKFLMDLPPGGHISRLLNYSVDGKEEYVEIECEEDNSSTVIITWKPDLDSALATILANSLGASLFSETSIKILKPGESKDLNVRGTRKGPIKPLRITHI